jgi:hypothetical protein
LFALYIVLFTLPSNIIDGLNHGIGT